MIGLKSVLAVGLAATAVALGVWRGVFSAERFVHMSAGSAFAVGLFASACAALVGFGWQPRRRSRTAIAVRAGKPAIVEDATGARELPALAQRVLHVVVFATIALGTLGNEATARIGAVPHDLTKPSRSEYCPPDEPAIAAEPDEPEPPPPPVQVEQAGCALVKRAFALGYAKSLGSCAPKTVAIAPVKKHEAAREVCTRRLLDEPFLHYAYRKVVDATSDAAPVDAVEARIAAVRTRVGYLDDLLADIRHAIVGTAHASNQLWIAAPDPHPPTWTEKFTGVPPCSTRFASLALWPAWDAQTPPGVVIEHVLGQLLFATRFGSPASCSDFDLHWAAPADACTRLVADPAKFLDETGALPGLRAVLDRRRRSRALRELGEKLDTKVLPPDPPPARAIASLACLSFDGPRPLVTRTVTVDGEQLVVRELHAAPIVATGAGPLAVYAALAQLLSGTRYAGPSSGVRVEGPLATDADASPAPDDGTSPTPVPTPAAPIALDAPDLPLLQLEPMVDADPFLGGAAPLDRADLVAIYPIEQHLHAFIDAFRRAYFPQRGRL